LEALDKDKRTALLLAVEKGNVSVAQTLLFAKANPSAKDSYSKTWSDLAYKAPQVLSAFRDLFAQFEAPK